MRQLSDLEKSAVHNLLTDRDGWFGIVFDMPSETAGQADKFLWTNVDDFSSGESAKWQTVELSREARQVFAHGNDAVAAFFKRYEDYRMFEFWCEFNPVTVYWSHTKGLVKVEDQSKHYG